jgi:hypothetical protein
MSSTYSARVIHMSGNSRAMFSFVCCFVRIIYHAMNFYAVHFIPISKCQSMTKNSHGGLTLIDVIMPVISLTDSERSMVCDCSASLAPCRLLTKFGKKTIRLAMNLLHNIYLWLAR